MMNRIITLLLALLLANSVVGQKLESFSFAENLQVSLLNIFVPGLNGTYSVNCYRVQYYTADTEGNEHLASGLVAIPSATDHLRFPLACYQHGTVAGREDVPSNLAGGYTLGVAFATHGYVVAMPDFVGLGISPGVHPYIHSATEASAGVDLLRATREMIEQIDNVTLNDQIFVSGYSQGGHAAMALQRELEMNHIDEFNLVASAPMSGPYSVSEKMRDFTLGDNEYMTVAYLAWLTLGYQRAYPATLGDIELADVFKPTYLSDIEEFESEAIDLWELNERMIATLNNTVGAVIPKNILQSHILDSLLYNPTYPLTMALADNDNYDWTPQVPTNLYYCVGDDQVTYENAILAEEVMTANGSTMVTAIRKDTDNMPLDHGGCVFPASFDALAFFDSFSEITNTAVKDFENHPGIQVSAHGSTITVDITAYDLEGLSLDLYEMSGRRISNQSLTAGKSDHQIAGLPSGGLYVAAISNSKGLLNITKLSMN